MNQRKKRTYNKCITGSVSETAVKEEGKVEGTKS